MVMLQSLFLTVENDLCILTDNGKMTLTLILTFDLWSQKGNNCARIGLDFALCRDAALTVNNIRPLEHQADMSNLQCSFTPRSRIHDRCEYHHFVFNPCYLVSRFQSPIYCMHQRRRQRRQRKTNTRKQQNTEWWWWWHSTVRITTMQTTRSNGAEKNIRKERVQGRSHCVGSGTECPDSERCL